MVARTSLGPILWTHAWKRLFQAHLEIIDFCQVTWRLSIKFDLMVFLQMFFIIMKGEHTLNAKNIKPLLYMPGLLRNWYPKMWLAGYQLHNIGRKYLIFNTSNWENLYYCTSKASIMKYKQFLRRCSYSVK